MVQRTPKRFLFRLFALAIVNSSVILGCAGVIERSVPLPARHALVMDQLVIHSDFNLPQHHRLLEDLRALRATLQAKLGLQSSDEPIHVYLFETESRFNAFSARHYPEFPTRRAFFVKNDTSLAVYAHWGDRVAEDLRHEVAHGYLHSVLPAIPLWLDEGLAEYFETPRGDAGLNRPHVALLNAQAASGAWLPDLPRLEHLSTAAEMTQTDYAESWAWIHLLLETIPQRRELLQNYLRSMKTGGESEPLSVAIQGSTAHPNQVLREHLVQLASRG